jgi:hypothetical protein
MGREPLPCDSARERADAIVFVGGCDRSGTTIVSRVIAERLSLVVLPEAFFHAAAYRRFGASATAQHALGHWRRRSWDIQQGDPRAEGALLTPYLRECMADIYAARRGTRSPLRVVESTPENIEIGSTLLAGFPEATLVHLVRDPRSVVSSLRRADFGPSTAQECARLWKQRVASGLGLELRYPERVVRLRFEDVLTTSETVDGRLGAVAPDERFSWDPDRDLLIDPTSHALQSRARGVVDPSRIDTWRSELSAADVAAIEYECRELMLAFGYELVGQPDRRSSTRRRLDAGWSILTELTIKTLRRTYRILRLGSPREWLRGSSRERGPS